jgi:hypothetical protein
VVSFARNYYVGPISRPRSFECGKASKARQGCQDADYSLSVAAGGLSRIEMRADGYLAALRESDEHTEVVAVALKEGPTRFIARITCRGVVLASRRNPHQKVKFMALPLGCVGLPTRIGEARVKLFVGFRL